MNCKDCKFYEHEIREERKFFRKILVFSREVCHVYNYVIDGTYVRYKESNFCRYFIERNNDFA